MRTPELAGRIMEAVVQATTRPVTVKMRLGWDDESRNAAELAHRAEAIGVKAVTVHGRTRCQFYKGTANWEAIRAVKDAISIPLVVNGDIRGFVHAEEALNASGADAVMVGRAAQGRPWLPGQIARYLKNHHYKTDEEYLFALADVMKREYKAIIDAGFILQADCPDLAMSYALYPGISVADYRKIIAMNVEALNQAVKDLPADRMRMHVCWGSTLGPHHGDIPIKDIVDIVLKAKPMAVSFPGANPRHGHEWKVWKDVKLPAGKKLIPGVISHATNIVEHPELVAQRLVRLANIVGRDNVMAGTDCGFAQSPFAKRVHESIMWAKLRSLSEGAKLASAELWGKRSAA